MWRYIPATDAPRISHTVGEVPPRPLEVGDSLRYRDGRTAGAIGAVTDTRSLFTFTHAPARPRFLAPVEGDMSGVIGEVTA